MSSVCNNAEYFSEETPVSWYCSNGVITLLVKHFCKVRQFKPAWINFWVATVHFHQKANLENGARSAKGVKADLRSVSHWVRLGVFTACYTLVKGPFLASCIRYFNSANPAQPPLPVERIKKKKKTDGILAARSQHSTSGSLITPPAPTSSNSSPSLRCLLSLLASPSSTPQSGGFGGSLPALRASARHPGCESHPWWQQQ